jgi:hypothetical protein
VKRSFRKDFKIIFLEEKIVFKINYLKRQGQSSDATGPPHWEKWVAALGQRRDEEKKCRLAIENWTKRAKEI